MRMVDKLVVTAQQARDMYIFTRRSQTTEWGCPAARHGCITFRKIVIEDRTGKSIVCKCNHLSILPTQFQTSPAHCSPSFILHIQDLNQDLRTGDQHTRTRESKSYSRYHTRLVALTS